MSDVLKLGLPPIADLLGSSASDQAWAHIDASLSEGHCPACRAHLYVLPPPPAPQYDLAPADASTRVTADGYCGSCACAWAAGTVTNADDQRGEFLSCASAGAAQTTLLYFRYHLEAPDAPLRA